jgi:hypothetical protein
MPTTSVRQVHLAADRIGRVERRPVRGGKAPFGLAMAILFFGKSCLPGAREARCIPAAALLAGHITTAVITDKRHDNNALRQLIADTRMEAVTRSFGSHKILIPQSIRPRRVGCR